MSVLYGYREIVLSREIIDKLARRVTTILFSEEFATVPFPLETKRYTIDSAVMDSVNDG